MQNLIKERIQLPVVILQQATFYNIPILYLRLRTIISSDQGVQFMNFFSQIFFNDINHDQRAAILEKNSLWLLPFLWLWLLISIMKTYAEQYHTSLKELEIYLLLLEKLSYKLCEKSFLQLNVLSRLKVFTGKNNYRLL